MRSGAGPPPARYPPCWPGTGGGTMVANRMTPDRDEHRSAAMRNVLSALEGRLISASYALGWWLVCRVPESWGRWVFDKAGEIAWRREGPGVQALEWNLRRVMRAEPSGKEVRALSRAAMSSYARYWFEVFRLPVMGADRLIGDMRADGEDRLFAAIAAERGVVLALSHMGNWDHAGAWVIACGAPGFTTVAERLKPEPLARRLFACREGLGLRGPPSTCGAPGCATVAERLKHESLARRFFAFREGLGFEVLPATGGVGRFGVLAQRLRAGGLVCLLADRDITGGGIEVDFFGEKAHMMAG